MSEYLLIALEEFSKRPIYLPTNWSEEQYLRISRGIGRFFLGILSILAMAAGGILWFVTPFNQLQGSPLWIAAICLLGFLSLFLVILNKPGDLRLLFLSSVLLATSFSANLWSNLSVRSTNDIYAFVLIFSTIIPILVFVFAIPVQQLDPLPIDSRLLSLFYPVRFKHLSTLKDFAQSRGWTINGLNGLSHGLTIKGNWQSCGMFIASFHIANKLSPILKHRNFVDILFTSEKILANLHLIPCEKKKTGNSCISIQGYRDVYMLQVYTSPQNPIGSINRLKETLSEGGNFLRKSSTLSTIEGELRFRCYDLKLLEDIETLHNLLTWLEKVTSTMRLQHFYTEETDQKFED